VTFLLSRNPFALLQVFEIHDHESNSLVEFHFQFLELRKIFVGVDCCLEGFNQFAPKFNLLLALVVAEHVAENFVYDVLGFVDFLLADLRNPFHGPDAGILVPRLLIFVKADGHHLGGHLLGHGMYVQKFPPDFRVHFLRTDVSHIQSFVEDSLHKRQ